MPGRRAHDKVGAAIGFGIGVLTIKHVPEDMRLFYLGGSTLAGIAAARVPDLLEPGTSSWHRSTCHSVAAAGTLGMLAIAPPVAINQYLGGVRTNANELRLMRESLPSNDPRRSGLWWKEAMFYFALGAVASAVPGYLSHLWLDAGTPRCIPLI